MIPMFSETPISTIVRTPRLRNTGSSSVPVNGVMPCIRDTSMSVGCTFSSSASAAPGWPMSVGR